MSVVGYKSADAVNSRGPSPSIWADCPVHTFLNDPSKGMHRFDDFKNSIVQKETASATDFTSGVGHIIGDINWYAYVESDKLVDCAIQADDDGHLKLDTDGTDDDVDVIVAGDNVVASIRSPKEGESKKFWFEVRLQVSTITDTDLSWFVGLMQPGQAGNGTPLGAAPTAPADVDYFGFFVAEADGDDCTIIYNEATSGTAQSDTGEITLVAATWVRLGMKLVINGDSVKMRFYEDGVDLGDDAAIDLSASDANWPGDTNMDLIVAVTSGAAGADGDHLLIDWIRVAQEY
jgi:hypothetical protein